MATTVNGSSVQSITVTIADFPKLNSDPPLKQTPINLSADTTLTDCVGIYVGSTSGGAIVKFDDAGNTAQSLPNLIQGVQYAGKFTKIYSTANGTTASSLFALTKA